jgi:hypothetical protein
MMSKVCSICNEAKPLSDFDINRSNGKEYRRGQCKHCRNKRIYAAVKAKRPPKPPKPPKLGISKKTCVICGARGTAHPDVRLSDFFKSSTGRSGYRNECKSCAKQRYADYAEAKRGGYCRRRGKPLSKMVFCESEMGQRRLYTGKYVKFWKDTLNVGAWPPGSIWRHGDGKRYIVWGKGEEQYAVELK